MSQRPVFIGYSLAIIMGFATLSGCATSNPWSRFKTPAIMEGQASAAIGAYSAGCVRGAEALPASGEGYLKVRRDRNRQWGHPSLIRWLTTLGTEVSKKGLTLLVSDLGQPRGGPTLTGHASHQSGLDADIWLWQPGGQAVALLTPREIEEKVPPSMVDAANETVDSHYFTEEVVMLLRTAVAYDEVERIFVNPVIKRELCIREEKKDWLRKLRPWWGHDYHFHVRLKCPPEEPDCRGNVEPVPAGSGCDETLNWWFSEEARQDSRNSEERRPSMPQLPSACDAVMQAPETL